MKTPTTEAQHTPLPWAYMHLQRGMYSSHQVINEKDVVCTMTGPHCKDNASFIVTACNSHSALLSACEAAIGTIEEMASNRPRRMDWHSPTLNQLRAAVALAKA